MQTTLNYLTTMNSKPKKRIALVDAGKNPEILRAVLPFVDDRYEIEITKDRDADYVFHSCFGYDVLKYSGIRIFVTGENVTPNFNISDYALAFDHLTLGDRYIRLPLFKLFPEAYESLCMQRPPAKNILAAKEGFCAYVMSNTKNSSQERIEIFEALTGYKEVSSGGKWRNNVGGPVADKIAFQSKHKFAIAFENSSSPGYLTEKFAQAAQSNCIPIYWGDPTIKGTFNPKAFINCHDYPSLEAVVQRIQQIDENDEEYLEMLSEPWFEGGKEPDLLEDTKFTDFLSYIFDQPHELAYRRNRSRWGIKTEKQLREMAFLPHKQFWRLLRNRLRR